MSGSGNGDDDDKLAAEWAAAAGHQLDQSDIDSLFGEPEAPKQQGPQRGLGVLVGGAVRFERLPMLDIVVDRLARAMTTSIRKFTADNADVAIEKTRPVRLGDFLNSISLPAMIAVIRAEQWDGYCLIALDSRLIGSTVDILLGGRKNQLQRIEGRPYTPIERTFVERFTNEVLMKDLKRAFEAVCEADFSLERFEVTPTYAAITKLSATAVTFRAEVMMEGDRGGNIDFLIPLAVLEPVRDVLSQEFVGKKQGGDTIWHSHLIEEVPQANVELRAVVEDRMISLAEVMRWGRGSVLVLNRHDEDSIDLFCEDLLVCRARIAEKDGRVALRVEESRIANDWPG